MKILTRIPLFFFCKSATNKIPLSLGYPFQYTLNINDFSFYDERFTEIAFGRQLHKPEKEHVHLVLKYFESILNGQVKTNSEVEPFIWKTLKQKSNQLKDIALESSFKLIFNLDLNSVTKSSGFYQIKPEGQFTLDEKDIQQIHNYKLYRDKQVLRVQLKEKRSELSPQEQLKQDIIEKMGNPGKEIKEKLETMKMSKQATYYNKLVEGFLSIGKKQKKSRKFEPYYLIDQIKGTFDCSFIYEGEKYKEEELEFDSKWIYKVTHLQSQNLKKYRKRTLFDFQFWQRGSIFPIRNFSEEINNLQ